MWRMLPPPSPAVLWLIIINCFVSASLARVRGRGLGRSCPLLCSARMSGGMQRVGTSPGALSLELCEFPAKPLPLHHEVSGLE